MISEIKLLYSMLSDLSSINKKKRREIFEELIKPVFEKLLEIHMEYFNMFSNIGIELPFKKDKELWTTDSESEIYSESEALEMIDRKIKRFLEEGEKGPGSIKDVSNE